MKAKIKKIADASNQSVRAVACQLRNSPDSFYRTITNDSMQLKEFKEFCKKCNAEVLVRDANGKIFKI